MYYKYLQTPVGRILCVGNDQQIVSMYWEAYKKAPQPTSDWVEDTTKFADLQAQLDEYFAGTRQTFDVPYIFAGTAFQMQVWQELLKIPYGSHVSYKDIAEAIGKPKAVRAVGTAVGSNPFSIIVPCHRVLTTANTIGGYAGGLEAKRHILQLESIPLM